MGRLNPNFRFNMEQLALLASKFKTVEQPKCELKPMRKNAEHVIHVINLFYDMGKQEMRSSNIAEYLRKLELDKHWDLDPNAKDGNGLSRAIGDIIGDHCLKLKKKGTRGKGGNVYIIPDGGITESYLKSVGINPN